MPTKSSPTSKRRRILVTGGAGFAGSSLAIAFANAKPGLEIVALDSLKRRGSELNLPRLKAHGVRFVHGDVRIRDDVAAVGPCDLVVDCAAEPSVAAGLHGGAAATIDANLGGTTSALEHARAHGAAFLLLSSSRVYPIEALRRLPYVEGAPRFEPDLKTPKVGLSEEGLSETFPLDGARSLYGATKLASELLVQEYVAAYDIKAVVLRLGVIAGPWQMGRVDQGVVTLWVARHVYGKPLSYVGFGGEGRQVRDVLHVDDFVDLAILVSDRIEELSGRVFNAGGGRFSNVSLRELTALCRDAVGREVPIGSIPETSRNDVPWYVTDATKLREATGFAPKRDVATVVEDVLRWIVSRRVELESVLE